MGKEWDHGVPGVPFWREALRVAKPGAPLLAFGGSRTFHRLACAIEDAGWILRDTMMWVYGSGFPKSLDISKAIDRRRVDDVRPVCRFLRAAIEAHAGETVATLAGRFGFNRRMIEHWAARDTDSQPTVPTWDQWVALRGVLAMGAEMDSEVWRLNGRKGKPGDEWEKREVVGAKDSGLDKGSGMTVDFSGSTGRNEAGLIDITAPATDAAKEWDGWGTALKPAWEPIVVAMKPLDGTFAENAQKWGVAGLWIAGGRIGYQGEPGHTHFDGQRNTGSSIFGNKTHLTPPHNAGRWPANLLLSHHPDCVCIGVKKVKTSSHSQGTSEGQTIAKERQGNTYSRFDKTVNTNHLNPDGTETVEAWECVPGCPVRMLDEQSGESKSTGGKPKSAHNWMGGHIRETSNVGGLGDTGGASRFFYTSKAPQKERWMYLTCDCETVILEAWQRQDQNQNEPTATTLPSPDTSEGTSTDECSLFTGCSGSEQTYQSPTDTASTTRTATSETTASKTSGSSLTASTSDSTADANSLTGSGGSPAESAVNSNHLPPNTSICRAKDTRCTGVVGPATSLKSWRPNGHGSLVCGQCKAEVRFVGHPTQKPLAIMRYLLKLVTMPSDNLILDPFCGSGSTLVACKELGLPCVGMELDIESVATAEARIAATATDNPLFTEVSQ